MIKTMNRTSSRLVLGGAAFCALAALTAATAQRTENPTGSPDATIDLATDVGVKLVKGQWPTATPRS